jgi:hypothetical protein
MGTSFNTWQQEPHPLVSILSIRSSCRFVHLRTMTVASAGKRGVVYLAAATCPGLSSSCSTSGCQRTKPTQLHPFDKTLASDLVIVHMMSTERRVRSGDRYRSPSTECEYQHFECIDMPSTICSSPSLLSGRITSSFS